MTDNFKKWQAFIGICLLSFGCYLDYTVVNVALPTIQYELKTSLTSLQWVMNIYFLVLCVCATLMGRCGDLYGRRRCFYLGAILFAVASLLAGLSSNINGLILGRFLQGLSAAIVLPLGPSLIPSVFANKDWGKAIGWLGSLGGIALALGPLVGGFIVTHWGWRWIFFINLPLTFVGFIFCINSLKESVAEVSCDLDWQGMLLMAVGMGGIVLALIHSSKTGWLHPLTLIHLSVGVVAWAVLFHVENQKSNPLLEFRDFSKLLFCAGGIIALLSGALSAVALFFNPLYLEIMRKLSPQISGILLFAIPLAVFVIALFVGWIVRVFGIINAIIIGIAVGAFAVLAQALFTISTPVFLVIFPFLALGAMWALGNTVSIIAAQVSVAQDRVSVATGTIITAFNIGGSLGLTFSMMIYHLANPGHSFKMPSDPALKWQFEQAFMHGYSAVMWFLAAVCAIAVIGLLIAKLDSKCLVKYKQHVKEL